ncbi:zinc finger and BTB domain-containing protein 32 [Perognathus longimembris pacificus]|uniref:zinc finger and BTB domain-containing protein 32 n=1 Tax=Perognathus longimembris pacificus TaxID=214514 RepID=UPI0020185AC9|nr:zinc finger and BTB domain-containing protein 32 [Perognathus longimembris pacificus]
MVSDQDTMPLPLPRLLSPYSSDRLVCLAAQLRPALCDTLITVGGHEFPAHSLVLAGVSQQLGRRGRWALAEGIYPSTFAQLLSFVYGESVELQPGELGLLEEAARALGVQALEEACRRARRDPAEDVQEAGLKKGQGSHGTEQKPEAFRTGGREQETLHKPPRESWEAAGTTPDGQEEKGLEGKLSQASVNQGEADGKQAVVMRVTESPEGSEKVREFPGPLPRPSSFQSHSMPRLRWAETPWLRECQAALWSLMWPPRYGAPISPSTSGTGIWQAWLPDQRVPLTLISPKGLCSDNQVGSCSPTPGSLPQGPTELGEPGWEHQGVLATWVGHEGTSGRPSRQPPTAGCRPYSCSACGKRFSLKHQMETHYRVHTGEKPFSCSLCPQRSRDFSAMTKHLRTHGAAPYRCPLCGAGRPSLASMQAHMRGHPPSQLPPGWTIRSTFLYSSSSSRPTRALSPPGSSSSPTTP